MLRRICFPLLLALAGSDALPQLPITQPVEIASYQPPKRGGPNQPTGGAGTRWGVAGGQNV